MKKQVYSFLIDADHNPTAILNDGSSSPKNSDRYIAGTYVEAHNQAEAIRLGLNYIYEIPDRFKGSKRKRALALCQQMNFSKSPFKPEEELQFESPYHPYIIEYDQDLGRISYSPELDELGCRILWQIDNWQVIKSDDGYLIYALCDGELFRKLSFKENRDGELVNTIELLESFSEYVQHQLL